MSSSDPTFIQKFELWNTFEKWHPWVGLGNPRYALEYLTELFQRVFSAIPRHTTVSQKKVHYIGKERIAHALVYLFEKGKIEKNRKNRRANHEPWKKIR